jgi:hypothetical protein
VALPRPITEPFGTVTVRSRPRLPAPAKVGVATARRTASHRIARVDGLALTLLALVLPVAGA